MFHAGETRLAARNIKNLPLLIKRERRRRQALKPVRASSQGVTFYIDHGTFWSRKRDHDRRLTACGHLMDY
jgi:hypothetical protein